ncbi:MAG: 2-C-methyl-D-erythritol 4-phosphate cytidylyltransferase [Planctomycetes bacterium]|nr:2-C-methyl-D-erythritol 4-phosphate cytidylyltransferase [Planctomycetota bacterium]MCC7171271.1 2-C-methyl-D-erythritol 4-phosphate cytidylyltransferase [Planctomycetota bacterium]
MYVAAIVVAAGSGRRLGAGVNKVLLPLAQRTILDRSVAAISADSRVRSIRVVIRPEDDADVRAALAAGRWPDLALVHGGKERADSVRCGLTALDDRVQLVLVHDAARPLLPPRVLSAVIDAGLAHGAAIPVVAVSDTLKRVQDGKVKETVDRSDLAAAQTPQAATLQRLRAAYARWPSPGPPPTDEAQVLERAGVSIAVVAGDARNLKITTAADLALAEFLCLRTEDAP